MTDAAGDSEECDVSVKNRPIDLGNRQMAAATWECWAAVGCGVDQAQIQVLQKLVGQHFFARILKKVR